MQQLGHFILGPTLNRRVEQFVIAIQETLTRIHGRQDALFKLEAGGTHCGDEDDESSWNGR